MSLAEEFERRLERVVEGVFSKAFRSDLAPAEIGRRMMREMESGKTISVGAVYVPNSFAVSLSSTDYEKLEGLLPNLEEEFSQLLRRHATERRWRPSGAINVSFRADDSIKAGRFDVEARHESLNEETDRKDVEPPALELMPDGVQVWQLVGDRLIVGRAVGSDIELLDSEVSRNHAELVSKEGDWWIIDSGSSNGTYVNGTLVKERRLHHGDAIKIGSTEFRYRNSQGED